MYYWINRKKAILTNWKLIRTLNMFDNEKLNNYRNNMNELQFKLNGGWPTIFGILFLKLLKYGFIGIVTGITFYWLKK